MRLTPQIASASTAKRYCSKTPAWAVTELLSKSHLFSCHYLRALPRAGKNLRRPRIPRALSVGMPEGSMQDGSTEKWEGG